MFNVVGRGCVILECRDDVRLGMTRFSAWSRVGGRSPVRGRRLSEGAILLKWAEKLRTLPDGLSRLYIAGGEKQEAILQNKQDEHGVTDPGANETAKERCRSKVSYESGEE